MELEQVLSYPWRIMLPEFTILGVATLMTLLDLFMKDKLNRRVLPWLGLAGTALAILFVCLNIGQPVQQILYDTYRLDGFGNAFKLLFLSGTFIIFLLSLDYLRRGEIAYQGEFYYLVLAAVLGAMILASSADIITMFVGLELLSISSYILVAIRKKNLQSNESAFKYLVSGGTATAITLYGLSFVYGLTGASNLFEIQDNLYLAFNEGHHLLIYLAFFLTFVGMSFKISAVPFHMWAPDVYQGAATPVTAFLAVVSKAAGFALIIRFFMVTFLPVGEYNPLTGNPDLILFDLGFFIAIAAALSMIIGNTLALRQTNVKRMFAFSSIAQAGYILVPFAVGANLFFFVPNMLVDTVIYYLLAYLLMTLGSFAVIQLVTSDMGTEELKSFAGLYHRAPYVAVAMTIFLISLAGLPITAGFVGKFYIFMGAIKSDFIWLAVVMVLTSVVSYFYYFGIITQMYMRPGVERGLSTPWSLKLILIACVFGTILLALIPSAAFEYFNSNFNIVEIFQPAINAEGN